MPLLSAGQRPSWGGLVNPCRLAVQFEVTLAADPELKAVLEARPETLAWFRGLMEETDNLRTLYIADQELSDSGYTDLLQRMHRAGALLQEFSQGITKLLSYQAPTTRQEQKTQVQ